MSATTLAKNSDVHGVHVEFEITDEMREEAERLARNRSGDGNVATGDRGRSYQKQKQDSIIGCLGEVVATRAFEETPVQTEFGNGVNYDIRLSYPNNPSTIDLEVKTRHHKPSNSHEQRDMFVRHHPSKHDVDLFMLVKVYPNSNGTYDRAELIGFCLPQTAADNAIRRRDIEDRTPKYMIESTVMRDNWDVLVEVVKKR